MCIKLDALLCLVAKRYKPFNKYEYFYETESLNALNGAVNGPKASCKVQYEFISPHQTLKILLVFQQRSVNIVLG